MTEPCEFYRRLSRREMIRRSACGFGGLALAGICANQSRGEDKRNTLLPRPPMFPARAKRVIFIFMQGGPSHV